jgi:hypothetical protein
MIRRYRTWAMTTGLAAALLPGCLSGPAGSRKDATDKPVLPAQGEVSGLQGQPKQSPYGQRELATQESTPADIQRTAAGPTQPAPPPEANVLSSQPQPLQPLPPLTGSSEVASIQQVTVAPPPQEEPLLLALRLYRQQQPALALEQLRKYDPSTRKLLALLLPLAARVSDIPLAKARAQELAVTLNPIEALIQELRSKAALTIENPCFCRIIKTFGEYEPLPEEHAFRYGDPVQVYLELHNLTTRRNGPHHETILTKTVRIYDSQRLPAGGKHPPDVLIQLPVQVHQSRIPHRDWYLNCSFYVPPNLPVGTYTLKIDIQDVTELPRGAKVPEERKASRELTFHVDPRGTGLVFTPTGQGTR